MRAAVQDRGSGRGAVRLVACCGLFNMALCFLGTRGWLHVSSTGVIVCELALLSIGLLMIRREIDGNACRVALVLALYLASAKLINPGLDLKILHDLAIIYIFYELGRKVTARTGSVAVWTVMVIVLAVGMFELLFTTAFGQVFDVWNYYVDKGALSSDVVNYSQTNLFLSANRGEGMGRTFLPSLLGVHRVSSIFLEPDSMGNFAAITFGWSLSAGREQYRRGLLLALSIFCIILADSRFATGCCALMLIVRFTPIRRSRVAVFAIPLVVMTALLVFGWANEIPGWVPGISNDDLTGRLLFSGRVLDYLTVPNWLALTRSAIYTSDTGYAYVINNVGLPLALFLLGAFAAQKPRSRQAEIMKAMIAVYLATSLCVGASVFTIKTASLLWFLYGTTNPLRRGRESVADHAALSQRDERMARASVLSAEPMLR